MLETIAVLLNRLFEGLVLTRLCIRVVKSLVNKTGIIMSVAKSDEIGKIAHLVWCKEQ